MKMEEVETSKLIELYRRIEEFINFLQKMFKIIKQIQIMVIKKEFSIV